MILRLRLSDGAANAVSIATFGITLLALRWMLFRHLGIGTRRRTLKGRSLALNKSEDDLSSSLVTGEAIGVGFSDVGGLEGAKKTLQENVIWPIHHPELMQSVSPLVGTLVTGILLYGPPGTGKTLLARALAHELRASFLVVSLSDVFSKFVGESEKNAAAVFSLARKMAPCVVFIDEVESLLSQRRAEDHAALSHVKSVLLSSWDGLVKHEQLVVVVAATNCPQFLDAAALRRLPIRVEVPLPDGATREQILCKMLASVDPSIARYIAERTDGYSGAHLKELVKTLQAMRVRHQINLGELQPMPLDEALVDEGLERLRGL